MRALFRVLLALLVGITTVNAQTRSGKYPDRPIRIIVPYAAGGPVDTIARLVGKVLSERLKQPVIIENKPGASGTIGANVVAKAPADGYTLLFAQSDTFVHAAGLIKNLPYDPQRDFQPIAQLVGSYTVMVVRPEVAGDGLTEILDKAKTAHRGLTYGSWGRGSFPHLVASTLARQSGIELLHVAYKGGAPSFQDFMAGQIDIAFAGTSFAVNLARTSQAKLVAIAGPSRTPHLPDVPTFRELGFTAPIFLAPVWAGIAAPANTPPNVIEFLEGELEASMKSPEVVRYLSEGGSVPMFAGSVVFREELSRQIPLVRDLMREAGVEPE